MIKKSMAAVLAAALMLAGCGGSESSRTDSSQTNSSQADSSAAELSSDGTGDMLTPDEDKPPETDEEWEQAMLKKSLVTLGDCTAVKAVIKKAQDGEKVTIAYLGGSITEGVGAGDELCYARLSYESFKKTYGKDGGGNVEYVNAGISGTPSVLGNMRLQRDVLSKEPDICFVEFAVNDASDEDHRAAYESVVRDLLEKGTAVVLLFSVTEEDYSAQDYMKEIGEYYGLPMISYCDALRYLFKNNRMTWKDFSDDHSHPNVKGHAMVAGMIDYFFSQAGNAQPVPKEYPSSPMSIMVQQGMQLLENGSIEPTSLGSWKKGSTVAHFTDGWTYDPDGDNEPLVFTFKGKFAHLIYKEVKSGNFGKLHVKVICDGETYDEKDITTVTKNGWGNPQTALLGMQAAEKEYRVEISMASGSEDSLGEILGIAHN
ncbi:MAG: SGNH/GDSL hydrolase family protein [Ruminococcus sp.]|nr:SGNH/GDSL hydrolase family protein [Ruminococcus sp.]